MSNGAQNINPTEVTMMRYEILKDGSLVCFAIARDLADALRVVGLEPVVIDGQEMNSCFKNGSFYRARVAL